MTPTEHIAADLAAIGCRVADTREIAASGPWGTAHVILTDGRSLLADYGPAGVHAWRWPAEFAVSDIGVLVDSWSKVSAATAGDALAIFDAMRAA